MKLIPKDKKPGGHCCNPPPVLAREGKIEEVLSCCRLAAPTRDHNAIRTGAAAQARRTSGSSNSARFHVGPKGTLVVIQKVVGYVEVAAVGLGVYLLVLAQCGHLVHGAAEALESVSNLRRLKRVGRMSAQTERGIS